MSSQPCHVLFSSLKRLATDVRVLTSNKGVIEWSLPQTLEGRADIVCMFLGCINCCIIFRRLCQAIRIVNFLLIAPRAKYLPFVVLILIVDHGLTYIPTRHPDSNVDHSRVQFEIEWSLIGLVDVSFERLRQG